MKTYWFLGRTYDACGHDELTVGGTVIAKGTSRDVRVPSNRFSWRCGSSTEWVTAPVGTNVVRVLRTGDSDRITWECYNEVEAPSSLEAFPASAASGAIARFPRGSDRPYFQMESYLHDNLVFRDSGCTVKMLVGPAVENIAIANYFFHEGSIAPTVLWQSYGAAEDGRQTFSETDAFWERKIRGIVSHAQVIVGGRWSQGWTMTGAVTGFPQSVQDIVVDFAVDPETGERILEVPPEPTMKRLATKIQPMPRINVRRRISGEPEEDPTEDVSSTVTVTAFDASDNNPVDGIVLVDGQPVARTGVSFTHRFVDLMWIEPADPPEQPKPRARSFSTLVQVRVPGFPDTQVRYRR